MSDDDDEMEESSESSGEDSGSEFDAGECLSEWIVQC